jgi:hypothetical protein
MDDLKARLREPVDEGTPVSVCLLLDEAADRIEAMEAHDAVRSAEIIRLEARGAELEAERVASVNTARVNAYADGRDAERADVVAWLRGDRPSDYTDPQYDIGVNLARGIEANAHRSNPDA